MKPSDPAGRHPHDPSELDNRDVVHEHSDINVRAVLAFAAGLVTIAAVVHVLMWGVFVVLERYEASRDPQISPLARPSGQLPPEPRLLTNEPGQLQTVREAEAEALHGYGWVDEAAGVAHIPIEQAKQLLLERGLPARGTDPVDAQLGTHAPSMGDSSGGRVFGGQAATKAPPPAAAPQPQEKGH